MALAERDRAPRRVGTIPAQTLAPGGRTTIDASRYFSDPDRDALTYTATSSNSSVARASVSGSRVTVTAGSTGSATITVTARDPGGLTASQRMSVTVGSAGAPDLEVPTVTPTSVTGTPGGSVRATFTIRNSGNATAAATTVRIYASSNSTISTSDTEIGDDPFRSLAAGQSRDWTVTVTLSSQASGTFYFGLCIDAVSGESDTQNNCSPGVRVTVGGSGAPDLEFTGISPRVVVVTSGTPFELKPIVANTGSTASPPTKLKLYLSDNSTISTSDRELDSNDIRGIAPSEVLTITHSITLTGSGSGYLGYCVDPVPGESDTTNNCSPSVRLTLLSSSNQTTASIADGISLVVGEAVLRIESVRVPDGERELPGLHQMIEAAFLSRGNR